ncbi:hypothetical protein TNCV_1676991 [Trichonephila clavipes]|nr:hypothetical protein TNCV_1676991 [Trichonephila clavipes]
MTPELEPLSPNYHTTPKERMFELSTDLTSSLPYTANVATALRESESYVNVALKTAGGVLATDLVILNLLYVTMMTPELVPPFPNYHTILRKDNKPR